MSKKPRKFPKLVVEDDVLVPITPEQEAAATEVLKGMMVDYLRNLRAQGRWLDSDDETLDTSVVPSENEP